MRKIHIAVTKRKSHRNRGVESIETMVYGLLLCCVLRMYIEFELKRNHSQICGSRRCFATVHRCELPLSRPDHFQSCEYCCQTYRHADMQTQTSLAGENGGELSSFYASQHFEGGSVPVCTERRCLGFAMGRACREGHLNRREQQMSGQNRQNHVLKFAHGSSLACQETGAHFQFIHHVHASDRPEMVKHTCRTVNHRCGL